MRFDERILVSGHRGEMTHHPENTMEAFKAAVGYGADMIETDVRLTADGIPVLRHDMVIPGIGRVCDHSLDALRKAKPDLPTFEEFLEYMLRFPDILLNIEFKDVWDERAGIAGEPSPVPRAFSELSQDRTLALLKEAGVEKRTWLNSFSGKLLERAYRLEGKRFRYHGFYPFCIMGEMETDPADFTDIVCMQHVYYDAAGKLRRHADPLCPEELWKEAAEKGFRPLAAPSLKSFENFDRAFACGARLVNANDPQAMIGHLKEKGLR